MSNPSASRISHRPTAAISHCMNIAVNRRRTKYTRNVGAYTEGTLYIDGSYFCDTLEDEVRPLRNRSDKVIGHTAIPAGTYRVLWTYSPKFKRHLPEIPDVPLFEGIRIHAGNTPEDTSGCLLVGRKYTEGTLTSSKTTLLMLCTKISSAVLRGEPVYITIFSP